MQHSAMQHNFISFSTSNLELLKQWDKIALFKNEVKKLSFFPFLSQGLTVKRIWRSESNLWFCFSLSALLEAGSRLSLCRVHQVRWIIVFQGFSFLCPLSYCRSTDPLLCPLDIVSGDSNTGPNACITSSWLLSHSTIPAKYILWK